MPATAPASGQPTIDPFLPRLSPDYIDIVSQTLPGSPALGPDVAEMLAQDAEHYLRQLIHVAKKRMHHSKRAFLSVDDIHLSDNRRDRQSSLGHFSVPGAPKFERVKAIPGLYVIEDETVSLRDILHRPLPPPDDEPTLHQSGVIAPFMSLTPYISPAHATHPVVVAVETLVTFPHRVSPYMVQRTLARICSSRQNVPIYPILTILHSVVNQNAASNGNSAVLYNALRVCMALAARLVFGIELFEDMLIVIVLTCLLAPHLGKGTTDVDSYQIRNLATDVLHTCLTHVVDNFARQKICNTLSAKLTHPHSSLQTIYGAIIGLATMGPLVFEPIFVPLLPKLIHALSNLSNLAQSSTDSHAAYEALYDITMLSHAVERSMDSCGLIYQEPGFDVIL